MVRWQVGVEQASWSLSVRAVYRQLHRNFLRILPVVCLPQLVRQWLHRQLPLLRGVH